MVNFGPLAAEIISLVWGTPANFDGLHILLKSYSILELVQDTDVVTTDIILFILAIMSIHSPPLA